MTIFEHLKEHLGKAQCPVVIELGAHTGVDTGNIMDAIPVGRHFAFEPDPRNAIAYRKLWYHTGKVQFIEAAVTDVAGWVPYMASYPYTGSGSVKTPKKHLDRWPEVIFKAAEMVQSVTLDGVAHMFGLDRIDLIWADVQGAEDLVIKGGKRALSNTYLFYTEYYNEEMYEGQMSLSNIEKCLPGDWELVEVWETEALFLNKKMRSSRHV